MNWWQATRRDRLLAGLRKPGCDDCPAKPGEWCDPMFPPPAEMTRWDRNPPLVLHSSRVAAAVRGGHVRLDLVIAQFADGPVPDCLLQMRSPSAPR